ncbi:(R)-1-hydroxy-2-aminoethylphosphonate ammonia-lyase [Roseovarius faecimaris]|uniref:(R)-1-hydroxy-2-aminoethylphosphonate ammonia-lyase n=1 Tax=Roseovarius faecimaris TaxID=2494550 RepID=UPI001FEA3220|nr:aspartate aminotransferase family protein [Roseovarius faecimaris]
MVQHTEGEANTSEARAEWAAREDHGPTRDLLNRDAEAFLHQSLSSPCVATIARAEGIWIEDTAGRRFMDFHGNSVHHIGYGHPRLVEAVKAQMDALPFSPRRFTNAVSVELAERLGKLAPGDLSKVLFTTGGSDANEVALKIARAATGRFKTLSFWDAFHGAGFGSASVGGEATFRSHIAGPLMPGTEHVAPFHCYRCAYGHPGPEACGLACAKMVEYVLAREGDVAAVIAEPMRAVPVVPPPGYWRAVREACNRHGALLIMDEIPTGLGKTGRMFAFDHDGIVPDIVTLGKALGGGMLPLAAVIARRDLDVCGEFAIGHYTHEKNPVTARAALTTLDIIEDEGLVERADKLGRAAMDRLHESLGGHARVGDIRGRGLMFGVEMVKDRDTRETDHATAEKIYYACLERGLSFKISAGSVLTLSPPLTIPEDDLDRALSIVEDAIREVTA